MVSETPAATRQANQPLLSPRRFWLDLALLCSGVFIAAGVYLTVYLPLIAQVHAPWEVYCPNVIPVATAAGVVAFISCVRTGNMRAACPAVSFS